MALVAAIPIGFFYTMLLSLHGIKVRFKYVALVLGSIIFCLNFFGYQVAGIGLAAVFCFLFVLAIGLVFRNVGSGIREAALSLSRKKYDQPEQENQKAKPVLQNNKNQQNRQGQQGIYKASIPSSSNNNTNHPETQENIQIRQKGLVRYYGVVFHLAVAILIALSIYTYSNDPLLSPESIDVLIFDAAFQFSSTILLIIIGIFNPFLPPSAFLLRIAEKLSPEQYPRLRAFLAEKRNWILIKSIVCLAIVAYFILKGYFIVPDLSNGGPFSNATVFMIGMFVIINLVQLIRNPEDFSRKNILRIMMLFQSAFLGIFVAAILVIGTLFFASDVDNLKVSSETILFLGFNIVMAYNEYKIADL